MEPATDMRHPASRIRTLSDRVANQIAAGEVVERPASVIKELVENALDAQATSVTVTIRNGGKSLIEVVDNGCGMSPDDAQLAFERHATSKIMSADDLKEVKTLGFRGEALPSIASVSRLSLATAEPQASSGTHIDIHGGILKEVRDAPPLTGTAIAVRDLFYNTPVRRKFLRSEQVEAEHAVEGVIRQALARPDVAFFMIRDDREVIKAPAVTGHGSFATRIADLFGKKIIDELTPVDFTFGGMEMTGYVSRPGVTRGSRATQYLYLNGRHIRDRLVTFAVADGYRSLMPKGRHPALFIRLAVPPERIDVNVHPTKAEVRFVDGRSVTQLVRQGVYEAMSGARQKSDGVSAPSGVAFRPTDEAEPWRNPGDYKTPSGPPRWLMSPPPEAVGAGNAAWASPPPPEPAEASMGHFDFAIGDEFTPLGQVFGSFLLVAEGERLLLLDQHTTHERILYEKFAKKYREGAVPSQELLFPRELELTAPEAELLIRRLADMDRLGYGVESFGETTFAIRSVPALLADKDPADVIRDLLDRLRRIGDTGSFDELAEEAINIMACRGAVKANDPLSVEEIAGLITQLKRCDLPYTCPHGRPIALSLTRDDLLKGFLRV